MTQHIKGIIEKENKTKWGQSDIALEEPIKENNDKETQSQKSKSQDSYFSKITPSQPEQKVNPNSNGFIASLQPEVTSPKMNPFSSKDNSSIRETNEVGADSEFEQEPSEHHTKELSIPCDDGNKFHAQFNEEDESLGMKPEEETGRIQRSSFSSGEQNVPEVSSELASKLQSEKGQSVPLSESVNQEMGQKVGGDFSNVRVHTNSDAIQMNKELGAKAFTHGNDIYFNNGQYKPDDPSGKHLLVHELTHVVQQEGGLNRNIIQRYNGDEIPSGGTFVNEIGIVAPEAKLRSDPSTSNEPKKKIEFNTRVQIVKELSGGWYYVSTDEGDTGYVASFLVRKGLPEPNSILHKIQAGESAIGIAEKYYKKYATEWGQDLRFYVNALVYVNKGEGDPSKGIYKASKEDGWKNTKVRSNYYIWIPSVGFAKSLKGVVESGSITYGIKEGIENAINFFKQKIDDFNYANQFVAKLLPQKLSEDILGALKAALVNFAIGMIAAGLLLAIVAGLGALIGGVIGFFAGGAGAAPGAALGAEIGFEVGLFLLKWIGLGLLVAYGAKLLGSIGVSFGKYIIAVWKANGDHKKLEESADLCAEAIKDFLLGVLELIIMLVLAWGVGRAMGALAKTKFGKQLGYDKLLEWINKRSKLEKTKEKLKVIIKFPQGFNFVEFQKFSSSTRQIVKDVGLPEGELAVQGSRASGTAEPTSDIDIILRVDKQSFLDFTSKRIASVHPGTKLQKSLIKAANKGKFSKFDISKDFPTLLMNKLVPVSPIKDIDFSMIIKGSQYDTGPFIDLL